MYKSMVLCALVVSSMLLSVEASALTLNGINYKLVNGTSGLCPDGNRKMIYNSKPYCRIYTASLSWSIPLTRQDGTALTAAELAGYEVYWTRDTDTTKGTIKVSGGGSQVTKLEVFKPDNYYFAISAIDTKGLKSPLSTVVSSKLGS